MFFVLRGEFFSGKDSSETEKEVLLKRLETLLKGNYYFYTIFNNLFSLMIFFKFLYTPGGHFIVTAGHCLKTIITRQPGNKHTLCP